MATNLFPEAAKYATKRKLIYEKKTSKGTIQIWDENGKYTQVLLPKKGKAKVLNLKPTKDISTSNLFIDTTSRLLLTPVVAWNIPGNTMKKQGEELVQKSKKAVKVVGHSISEYVVNPLLKWALIGAGAYLLFLFLKKQIEGE